MSSTLFTIEITDLNPDGNGVGRLEDGRVVFVPSAAPGDVWEVGIIKETSRYLVGRPENLLSPSPDRVSPDCPYYKRCGGCTFRHITPESERTRKQNIVQNCFSRIGKLDVTVEPVYETGETRYRNKVVYPLAVQNGKPTFGYYARHTHTVIPHDDCLSQDNRFSEIASFFVGLIEKCGVSVRDEQTGRGVLRHLAMRKTAQGHFSVCVIAQKRFAQAEEMAHALLKKFSFVTGVSLNLNRDPGNVIFGTETIPLAGEPVLTDMLCGKTFRISPASFYQVNHDCAEKLYEKAAFLADLQPGQTLLDLYCGAGTIGLSMMKPGQKLCGVEIIPDAVENARANAAINGRTDDDTLFVCGDASVGVAACREKFGTPDVIVVDPPRKGLSREVIDTLIDVSPRKIVYVSCDPATLAANCADLVGAGYSVTTAYPFNMFPRTGHVETVVLLSRA